VAVERGWFSIEAGCTTASEMLLSINAASAMLMIVKIGKRAPATGDTSTPANTCPITIADVASPIVKPIASTTEESR
jgi:hypothetical protein